MFRLQTCVISEKTLSSLKSLVLLSSSMICWRFSTESALPPGLTRRTVGSTLSLSCLKAYSKFCSVLMLLRFEHDCKYGRSYLAFSLYIRIFLERIEEAW